MTGEASAYVVVSTTVDDRAVAETIARTAVEQRLAACARLHGADSVYQWEGEIQSEPEIVIDLKTTAAAQSALEALIRELHPYELPEIVVYPILGGSRDYLAWVSTEAAG